MKAEAAEARGSPGAWLVEAAAAEARRGPGLEASPILRLTRERRRRALKEKRAGAAELVP